MSKSWIFRTSPDVRDVLFYFDVQFCGTMCLFLPTKLAEDKASLTIALEMFTFPTTRLRFSFATKFSFSLLYVIADAAADVDVDADAPADAVDADR